MRHSLQYASTSSMFLQSFSCGLTGKPNFLTVVNKSVCDLLTAPSVAPTPYAQKVILRLAHSLGSSRRKVPAVRFRVFLYGSCFLAPGFLLFSSISLLSRVSSDLFMKTSPRTSNTFGGLSV